MLQKHRQHHSSWQPHRLQLLHLLPALMGRCRLQEVGVRVEELWCVWSLQEVGTRAEELWRMHSLCGGVAAVDLGAQVCERAGCGGAQRGRGPPRGLCGLVCGASCCNLLWVQEMLPHEGLQGERWPQWYPLFMLSHACVGQLC